VRVRLRAYWVVSQSSSRLRRSVDALKKILGSGSVCCARTRPLLACPTRRSSRRSGRNRDEHSRARTSLPGRPQDTVAVRTHHPHCLSLSPLLAASTHRFRTGSHHCPGTDSACTARTPRTADRPCPQPNATRGGRPSSASSSLRPTHFLSALAQRRDSRPGRRKLCAME
jgi:hypothetical protein